MATLGIIVPCILRYHKPGRGAISAFKIVRLGEHVILAQPVRHQRGAFEFVSIPVAVLEAARRAGAVHYIWRNDRLSIARRLRLAEAERRAVTVRGGELFFRLADLESIPPPHWSYVTEPIVEVMPSTPPAREPEAGAGRQLSLFGLLAPSAAEVSL